MLNQQLMGNILGNSKQPQVKSNLNQNQNQQMYQNQGNIQMQNNYLPNFQRGGENNNGTIRLLNEKQEDKNKKVVAVIVTLQSGGSYDCLFTTVEQKSLQDTKVEVYACDALYLTSLIDAFNGKPKDDIAIRLMKTIKEVDKDCVVFNWECCGIYSGETFCQGNDKLFTFVRRLIDLGHMCMFSDFSLKALVRQWNQKYQLGPNPFVKTGEHSGHFQLRFNNGSLKECPSAQLQIIGEMAENGKCNVEAMGGTIVYCVDNSKLNHKVYKLQVLTIVSNIKPAQKSYTSKIGDNEGSAGHVLLTYPSGGMILTSMGHWIELMKIDTSEKKLFEVAEREYGIVKANKMRQQYNCMDVNQQSNYISSNARQFVQNQAPCSNMNKKARF